MGVGSMVQRFNGSNQWRLQVLRGQLIDFEGWFIWKMVVLLMAEIRDQLTS